VSEADDILLGRAELECAFTALGERLARRGVVADVFIVGGAAMALAYDATRVTRDVDARFIPHGIVHEEATRVADALGLPRWWLNEQASVYISGKEDAGKRRVFDHPGLRVMAASPHHIFAMKALAARTRDIDDPSGASRHRRESSRPTMRSGYAPTSIQMNRYRRDRLQSSGSFSTDCQGQTPDSGRQVAIELELHEAGGTGGSSSRASTAP
jgi:hypothetical protein